MMNALEIANNLRLRGIGLSLEGGLIRATGTGATLSQEDHAAIQEHRQEIIEILEVQTQLTRPVQAPPPYPNAQGKVKCVYCQRWKDTHCTAGHQPDGIALLRKCEGFVFTYRATLAIMTPWPSLPDDPVTRWRVLADTGLDDRQVIPLDDALFLFAIRKVQHAATTTDLQTIWQQYSPYWKRRLVPAAWQIVVEKYQRRSSRPGTQQPRNRTLQKGSQQ
jgi:hypothetical protein